MPRWPTILSRWETTDTFGHGVDDIGVNIPALVKPRERKLERVQVGYVICVVQRTEHNLALNIADLEEVSLLGPHPHAALPGREPVEERLDRRIFQLPRSFADHSCTRTTYASVIGCLL